MTNNEEHIFEQIHNGIESKDAKELELAIDLIWTSGYDLAVFTEILNELLLVKHHISHQVITKTLQSIASPTSVPFIRKVLETNFDYLEYTCSEDEVITKWFSWALYAIGTNEAINLMREYTFSSNEGIKNEMIYRLNKLKSN